MVTPIQFPTLVIGIGVVCASAGVACGANGYVITPLGSFGGGISQAYGLNNAGQVVGASTLLNGDTHAFLWTQASGMQDLGTLSGDILSVATSINNSGEIVGYSQPENSGQLSHAFSWQAGSGMVNLAGAASTAAAAFNINDGGQIAGQSYFGTYYQFGSGFVYTAATGLTPVTISGVPTYDVRAVNGNGQMLVDGPQSNNSLLYAPGQVPVEIQGPTSASTEALAINDGGTVIGDITGENGSYTHAFIWNQDGGLVDLTPGANVLALATGLNEESDVVGAMASATTPGWTPFLYENGVRYDLTTLLGANATGWTNLFPEGINDNGQIAGIGTFNGEQQAFLISPGGASAESIAAPEPTSLALLTLATPLLLKRRPRIRKGAKHV
jgi:probable HAF family extracellular repeat protein